VTQNSVKEDCEPYCYCHHCPKTFTATIHQPQPTIYHNTLSISCTGFPPRRPPLPPGGNPESRVLPLSDWLPPPLLPPLPPPLPLRSCEEDDDDDDEEEDAPCLPRGEAPPQPTAPTLLPATPTAGAFTRSLLLPPPLLLLPRRGRGDAPLRAEDPPLPPPPWVVEEWRSAPGW